MAASKFTPNKEITDVLNNNSSRLIACHQILDKRLGTESTYQLAVDILKELGEECKEELKEEFQKSSGKAKGKDGESEESTSIETGPESASEDKGSGEKLKEDDYRIFDVKLSKEDLDKYSLTVPEEGEEMGKIGINIVEPVNIDNMDWDMTDYSKFIVVDYPKNTGPEQMRLTSIYTENFKEQYEVRVGDKLVSQENFAQQVRKLIQIRARVQTQYGTKKGKLDQSRLSRICFNAPGFNERIFKNKIENKTLDAAITVLVDMSGSMNGDKAYYALASTLLLNEVSSTLNIPVEILGFTDTDGYNLSLIHISEPTRPY